MCADKGFDTQDFVNELRAMNVTLHVAQNPSRRRSAIDGQVTRHAGYAVSQRILIAGIGGLATSSASATNNGGSGALTAKGHGGCRR